MTQAAGGAFPAATRRITDPEAQRDALRAQHGEPVAVWRGRGARLEGWGLAARAVLHGPGRFADATAAWREHLAGAGAEAVDEVRVPGSGPVAFGAFAFADDSAAPSVLLVPRVVIGERDGLAFRTDQAPGRVDPLRAAVVPPGPGTPPERYEAAVAEAVRRIRDGELAKAVLARDVLIDGPVDLERVLERLAERYRDAWTFAVDGFLGASPETLVTVRAGVFGSRVLAGTAPRLADAVGDDASRDALVGSAKNRFEHALAVDSLLLTLGGLVDDLGIGRPFALGLPNVWHLATDAEGRVRPGIGVLDLVAALHPTAAVAGAPRDAALALIAELEPFDRRRYAGPVGWLDARGDGEWAIGLRSAEVEGPDRVRAYAGAGVVAGSDPAQELAETEWKLVPIRDALAPAPVPGRPALPRGLRIRP